MAFDFKKEYPEYYLPQGKPAIVNVPAMQFVAVTGQGDPNEEGGDYQRALAVLYAVSYTLRMSEKGGRAIDGFFEYVVPPLEGFWRREDASSADPGDKTGFCWTSVIRLPDFVAQADFDWAVAEAQRKKKLDCSAARLARIEEGLCVQAMHIGSYDDEPATIAAMAAYAAQQGYRIDIGPARLHHEIYLSDPRRTAPEKRKTVIRYPIAK